jgi:hypothetical protein
MPRGAFSRTSILVTTANPSSSDVMMLSARVVTRALRFTLLKMRRVFSASSYLMKITQISSLGTSA